MKEIGLIIWGANFTQKIYAMYATRLVNQIYHLVPPSGNHTLCGLRISRIPSGSKLAGNLQLVDEVPPSKTICKHCERIRNQPRDSIFDSATL